MLLYYCLFIFQVVGSLRSALSLHPLNKMKFITRQSFYFLICVFCIILPSQIPSRIFWVISAKLIHMTLYNYASWLIQCPTFKLLFLSATVDQFRRMNSPHIAVHPSVQPVPALYARVWMCLHFIFRSTPSEKSNEIWFSFGLLFQLSIYVQRLDSNSNTKWQRDPEIYAFKVYERKYCMVYTWMAWRIHLSFRLHLIYSNAKDFHCTYMVSCRCNTQASCVIRIAALRNALIYSMSVMNSISHSDILRVSESLQYHHYHLQYDVANFHFCKHIDDILAQLTNEQRSLDLFFLLFLLLSLRSWLQSLGLYENVLVCLWTENDTHMAQWYNARWWFALFIFHARSFFFQNALWVYIHHLHI